MIYITGDTHGDIDYKKLLLLKNENVSYDDYLIICGDAGICWSDKTINYHLDLYDKIKCTIIFVDGNHENFDMLNSFPIVVYKKAKMHQINDHIFRVLRGEIMEIDGISFLCIGGAESIDKYLRTPFISWWPDEQISNHDIENAIKNLEQVHFKVDYVITHCVDTPTVMNAFGFSPDSSTNQLNFIDKTVDYKHWYFGHYHFDTNINEKKTCLYNNIIKIKKK